MQRRWIPIVLVAGLLTSCASAPTAPKQVLPGGVDFEIAAGFTIADWALHVETDGQALLRRVRHYDGATAILRGRLSDAEIAALAAVLPSFGSFEPSYCDGLGPTDAPYYAFTLNAAAGPQRVVVCSNDSWGDVPQGLRDLRDTLTQITWRLENSAPRDPFGAPNRLGL